MHELSVFFSRESLRRAGKEAQGDEEEEDGAQDGGNKEGCAQDSGQAEDCAQDEEDSGQAPLHWRCLPSLLKIVHVNCKYNGRHKELFAIHK